MTSNRAREGRLGKGADLLPYLPIPLAAAIFYVRGVRATGGAFPVPLDDTYIHFDFARATAEGHPFQWIAGQGYSSGETAVLYPFALAPGYLLGFRGASLALWAAFLALLGVALLAGSVTRIVPRASPIARASATLLLVGIGVVDWSFFSGMETALFAGALGVMLLFTARATERDLPIGAVRASLQARAGLAGALLVLLRPEAVVVVFSFAVLAASRAKARSAFAAALRVGLPAALLTVVVLLANTIFEGHTSAAGAKLKLLSEQPFLTDEARAREFVQNLLFFKWKVIDAAFSAVPGGGYAWAFLALLALVARRTRPLAIALVASALFWTLLVSWNGAARYQNFRYYAPPLLFFQTTAALGVLAFAERSLRTKVVVASVAALAVAVAAPRLLSQADHFARASANIHRQQVEVGRRLGATMPEEGIVLVGDAGAIPYFAKRSAIDALGLGGYHHVPFVLAANHGEAAILELLEGLPENERPTHLALYPNWFPRITARFGREQDHVTIGDNVICGGATKGIYRADWSTFASAGAYGASTGVVDELDVADVTSERAHDFVSPAPRGGFTEVMVLKTRSRDRFDGGRLVPEGQSETFTVGRSRSNSNATPFVLVARVADEDGAPEIVVDGAARPLALVRAIEPGRWGFRAARLEYGGSSARVRVVAKTGTFRSFHYFVVDETHLDATLQAIDE